MESTAHNASFEISRFPVAFIFPLKRPVIIKSSLNSNTPSNSVSDPKTVRVFFSEVGFAFSITIVSSFCEG